MLLLTWADKSGFAQAVRFDVVSSATWESLLSITSHPVEEGAAITDHASPEPKRLTIEGYVSNKPTWMNPGVEFQMAWTGVELRIPEKQGGAPLYTPGGLTQAAISGISALVSKPPPRRAVVLKATGDMPQRDREVLDKLLEAQEARSLVRVYSRIREIDSMLIERITVPQTPENGNGSLFQIDLTQIFIARSELVPDPMEARGMLQQAKGSKAAQAAANDARKAEQAQQQASLLYQVGAGLFGR
jgi:hypothetical protein